MTDHERGEEMTAREAANYINEHSKVIRVTNFSADWPDRPYGMWMVSNWNGSSFEPTGNYVPHLWVIGRALGMQEMTICMDTALDGIEDWEKIGKQEGGE